MRYSVPTRLAAVLALLLAAPLAACSQTKTVARGTAPSDGFRAPSKEFVWDIAAQMLRESGMEPSSEESSRQTWTIVTHWRLELAPFAKQGFRQRAIVKILDVPDQCDPYYYTETQVVRQVNDNMCEPSNPLVAQWGSETRCAELECIINKRIQMYFLPGGISPELRQQYRMDDVPMDQDCIRSDTIQREPEPPPPPPSSGLQGTMGR